MARRRQYPVGTRGHVVWTAAWVVAVQAALAVYFDARHPEVFDPEYSDRLIALRRLAAAEPDSDLLLIVGSSRITSDVRPEVLPPLRTAAGVRAVPFNFSHSGAGPLLNLVEVSRLYRAGFRPRWAVVELLPAVFPLAGHAAAAAQAGPADVPLLARYVPPGKLGWHYLAERSGGCVNHRWAYLRHLAPWAPLCPLAYDSIALEPLGGSTAWLPSEPDPAEVARRTAVVRGQYAPNLQKLTVHESADRALRELLDLCRRQGTDVVLLLTPESGQFRGWYPPEAERLVRAYTDELRRECGVPVVDARSWMADGDFVDGHHLHPYAAVAFTERLGREVLEPLAGGQFGRAAVAARP